ncbi:MAG: DUF4956 domain-containing protein [Candidatus Taylorbacteria bacterium]|nr:DUF4956 domain-containing protein [Candidatus Taylorbacteria bacterium]
MNNFYNLTVAGELSAAIIVLNILFSLLLQLCVVLVYKRTHRGLSYAPSFVFTLVIVGILGTVIMMIVQQNLIGAVALLGAFSFIRFRTILKETRDVAFLFFALAAGIAVGTNNYSVALISVVLISIIIMVLDRFNFGSISSNAGFILTFNAKDRLDINTVFSVLKKYSDSFGLLQSRTHAPGVDAFVFSVRLRDELQATEVLQALKANPSLLDIELITGDRSVEY